VAACRSLGRKEPIHRRHGVLKWASTKSRPRNPHRHAGVPGRQLTLADFVGATIMVGMMIII